MLSAYKVFGAVARDRFIVDIDNKAIRYYSGIFVFIFLQVLVIWSFCFVCDCNQGYCHTPNPGPTRLADPNRFPERETQDWDSLPDFFFKPIWYLWVWPTIIIESKYHIKRTTT